VICEAIAFAVCVCVYVCYYFDERLYNIFVNKLIFCAIIGQIESINLEPPVSLQCDVMSYRDGWLQA